MGSGARFTTEQKKVIIRSKPCLGATALSSLEKGDEIVASEVFIEDGLEWVRLCKGTSATRLNAGKHQEAPLRLREDGYVPTQDPAMGTLLRKHAEIMVQEIKEDGVLSKAEIAAILEKCSDPGSIQLPLESKYWTKHQFELFVMSNGVIRPAYCSIPDERLMENINMTKEEVLRALSQAADWIADADAILIGSGAGMGVESGLGTFRGATKGVWPGLDAVGLAYEDICHPKWFREEPHLAWGFWNFCHETYQATAPHAGYTRVHEWAKKCPLGSFSFTSNIDSHWSMSGFDNERILEVHGAVRWLQCSKPCCADVWKAPAQGLGLVEDKDTHRVRGVLPTCPKCKSVARPDVQMFGGDTGFSKARRSVQLNRYDAWLKSLEARPDKDSLRVTCIELGCGLTVPTVRKELEGVMRRFPSARYIRVNPENPGLSKELCERGVSLPLCAGDAIQELHKQVSEEGHLATFVIWDQFGGGAEIRAPHGTNLGRLLRMVAAQGSEVAVDNQTCALVSTHFSGVLETVSLDSSVSLGAFAEVKAVDNMQLTAVLTLQGGRFVNGRMNPALEERALKVAGLLDSVNELFADPAYQENVRKCADKRSVMKMARAVQFQVLPKYGIEATDKGAVIMAAFTSSAAFGPGMQEKIQRSMFLSYVGCMEHLPHQAPRMEETRQLPTPSLSSTAPLPPDAPDPLEVTLFLQASADDCKPEKCPPLSVTSQTTLAELRLKCQEVFKWDQDVVNSITFLRGRPQRGFATLQETDIVDKVLYVRGAPSLRRSQQIEVTFTQMAPEEGLRAETFCLTVMTSDTISAARAKLAAVLGLSDDDLKKRCRFLIRLNPMSFGALKDHEVVGDRKVIFVHGLFPLPRVAVQADAPAIAAIAATSSESARQNNDAAPCSTGSQSEGSKEVARKPLTREAVAEELFKVFGGSSSSADLEAAFRSVPPQECEAIFWRIAQAPLVRRLGVQGLRDRHAVEKDKELAPIFAKYESLSAWMDNRKDTEKDFLLRFGLGPVSGFD